MCTNWRTVVCDYSTPCVTGDTFAESLTSEHMLPIPFGWGLCCIETISPVLSLS